MSDADYLFALELQNRLNAENGDGDSDIEEIVDLKPSNKLPLRVKNNLDDDNEYLNQTQNLVHPQWEVIDPTPDIHSLFGAFDLKFFQGRLKCVTLEWSKKMYSCAGICYSRSNRFGMDITIRLSEPLLKLRPRKNLVETMLHEMIHAYCFVLHIREGNGGHGPNFKKIMHAINKVAGTNITVYHTFRDEVELYKQHVWRCNGICQHRAPFYGYVKRTSNRAPGPNDQWWAAHQESCGGYFQKIQEPEKKKKVSKAKDKNSAGAADLRKFLVPKKPNDTLKSIKPSNSVTSNINRGIKGPIKVNGGGTMLLNPKTKTNTTSTTSTSNIPNNSISSAFPPSSYPGLSSDPFNSSSIRPVGGNLKNVKSFRDLNTSGDNSGGGSAGRVFSGGKTLRDTAMTGTGYSLSSTPPNGNNLSTETSVDRNHLRNVWAKRFGGSDSKKTDVENESLKPAGDSKRRRLSAETPAAESLDSNVVFIADEHKASDKEWDVIDDDIMLTIPKEEIIQLSSDDDSDSSSSSSERIRMPPKKHMTADERHIAIKKEITDETIDLRDEDIILIDDEYDAAQDNEVDLTIAAELADTSIIDEFFGDDTLLKEFKRENDVKPTGSRYIHNPDDDIITCPICQGKMQRRCLNEHLNGCTGISTRVQPPPIHQLKNIPMKEVRPQRKSRPSRKSAKDILRDAGYTEADLLNITSSSADENDWTGDDTNSNTMDGVSPKAVRQRSIYKTTRQCPACGKEVEDEEIYEHLDECVEAKHRKNC